VVAAEVMPISAGGRTCSSPALAQPSPFPSFGSHLRSGVPGRRLGVYLCSLPPQRSSFFASACTLSRYTRRVIDDERLA
jgi:hypothetical protein